MKALKATAGVIPDDELFFSEPGCAAVVTPLAAAGLSGGKVAAADVALCQKQKNDGFWPTCWYPYFMMENVMEMMP
eukprot:scaffold361110_cov15-Prasinocladus_malaysianus.AAC.1